jgi:RNA polymerase sigma-70 factor (ECF subfamily)
MNDLDELLPLLALGDVDAFGRFVAGAELAVRQSLRSFAARVDTEAVVQETFLRVWQVVPRFTPDGRRNGLLRLSVRIARNLAVSELRRRREEVLDEGSEEPAAEPSAIDPLLRRVISFCLEKLAGPTRAALGARLESGGTEPDATLADRVGMRTNTFLQNVTRARKLVAECLRAEGVELDPALFGGAASRTEAP